MLLTTYNPDDAQTVCPTCKKFCQVYLVRGNLAFYPRKLEFFHRECGAHWMHYVDRRENQIEILDESPADQD